MEISHFKTVLRSSIMQRMAKGALWTLLGTATSKFLVLLSSIICARILMQEQYGEMGMIRSTVGLFASVGSVGLGMTASKYIAQYRKNEKKLSNDICSLSYFIGSVSGLIITLIILFFGETIAVNLLNNKTVLTELKIGAFLIFVTIINAVQNGILTGVEDFKQIAINNFFTSIFESVAIVVGAYLYGVTGAIIGFGASYILLYVLNRGAVKKHGFDIDFLGIAKINKEVFKLLYKFSIPAAISSLIVAPTFWGIRTVLINYNGYTELAIYELADQWKIIILFLPTSLSSIVLPILSSMSSDNNGKKHLKRVLLINIFVNGGIAAVATLVVATFGRTIVDLYGFSICSAMPLILLAVSTIFISVSHVIGLAIASLGKMWHGCLFNIMWMAYTLLFCWIFITQGYGATGAAASICLGYFLHTIIQSIYLFFQYEKVTNPLCI